MTMTMTMYLSTTPRLRKVTRNLQVSFRRNPRKYVLAYRRSYVVYTKNKDWLDSGEVCLRSTSMLFYFHANSTFLGFKLTTLLSLNPSITLALFQLFRRILAFRTQISLSRNEGLRVVEVSPDTTATPPNPKPNEAFLGAAISNSIGMRPYIFSFLPKLIKVLLTVSINLAISSDPGQDPTPSISIWDLIMERSVYQPGYRESSCEPHEYIRIVSRFINANSQRILEPGRHILDQGQVSITMFCFPFDSQLIVGLGSNR